MKGTVTSSTHCKLLRCYGVVVRGIAAKTAKSGSFKSTLTGDGQGIRPAEIKHERGAA